MRGFQSLPVLSIAFLTGTGLLLSLAWLPQIGLIVTVSLVGLALATGPTRRYSAAAGCVLLGFAWAALDSGDRLAGRLIATLHNTDHALNGVVTGLVRRRDETLSFSLLTALPGSDVPVRVDVRWYEHDRDALQPKPGERWQLTLRLREPRGLANPGHSSFERYAFRERIAATAYVRHGDNRRLLPRRSWRLDAFRDNLSRRLATQLARHDSASLIIALAVGDRQYLNDQQWQVIRRTGLSHLLAISGLHIGMVALTGYWLGAGLGSLAGRGVGTACIAAAIAGLVYAALAGFTIPTRRALIVILVLLLLRWRRMPPRPVYALALALWLIVIADPVAVLDAGFWLSFCAVALILYVTAGTWPARGWRGMTSLQFRLCAGLAPLVLYCFGEVSLIAPFVNLLAVPLASSLIVPLTLCGTLLSQIHAAAGHLLLSLVARLLDSIWPALAWLADQPVASWVPGPVPIGIVMLAAIAMLWVMAPPGWPGRRLGLVMLLPLIFWQPPGPAHGELELRLLDVGHGLSVVLRTRRHVLIYDTGPVWRSGNDAARRVVIPYLQYLRISRPDRLIVSHADSDHAGGLESLLARYPSLRVLASGLPSQRACRRGERWYWDGVAFEVLHPDDGVHTSDNNASCVLRIRTGGYCVLLTGDIEAAAERQLVASGQDLRCDVALAAHHGSETSSTATFVSRVAARHVLFSTGYANRWGFPRRRVLERWWTHGAYTYDTGRDGAINVSFKAASGIEISRYRCRVRRIWLSPCPELSGPVALGRPRR